MTGVSLDTDDSQHHLARAMESASPLLEPRLTNVTVLLQPTPGPARVVRLFDFAYCRRTALLHAGAGVSGWGAGSIVGHG